MRVLRRALGRLRDVVSGEWHAAKMMHPPGHFYSPIPDLDAVARRADRIFARDRRELPGIALNEPAQVALLEALARYYPEMPFRSESVPGLRYHFANPYFCQSDAVFLYAVMRHFRPKRVIEVGSGFSSAVMLDTNDRFLDREVRFTFVEPFPDRLKGLLTADDARGGHVTILPVPVQDVEPERFDALEANDILFVDSSHVAKVGSDVNHILFEILPRLRPGVLVHFHDVFHPFEYPREWVMDGICWNEAYMLRAFLSDNRRFEVLLFNTFLARFHEPWFRERMPVCLENTGGSLWLRRI